MVLVLVVHKESNFIVKVIIMRKIFFFLLILSSFSAFAQPTVTTVGYAKENKSGLMLVLPYDEKVSEGTILQKLKETGYDPETKGKLFWKDNKVNGFYVFKAVSLSGGNSSIVDLYFKVDPAGKKDKNQSIIYLLVSKGNENFITEDSDPGIFTAAKSFLGNFTTETATYKHNLDIQNQEDVVKKAEKKLNSLMDDEKDLNKKILKLQDDLKKNKQDQENQQNTLDAEKRKLEDLKAVKG